MKIAYQKGICIVTAALRCIKPVTGNTEQIYILRNHNANVLIYCSR